MAQPDLDVPLATLRAMLVDDMDKFRDLHGGLNAAERRVFAALLTAAFGHAVTQKFGERSSLPDIVEFVARARAYYVGPETVSAEDSERMIRAALGEEDLIDDMDTHTFGTAQTAMLIALVRDREASASEIDGLLDDAVAETRSFFERNG